MIRARRPSITGTIIKASPGASYAPYQDGVLPWHAAMAATYAHATAPLRRLADRYVIRATLAIANGQPVPDVVTEAFPRLPQIMAHGDGLGGQVDRAVIDLAEAVMLRGQEGRVFAAIVTTADQRGLHVQLRDLPIVATSPPARACRARRYNVALPTTADPEQRHIGFEALG